MMVRKKTQTGITKVLTELRNSAHLKDHIVLQYVEIPTHTNTEVTIIAAKRKNISIFCKISEAPTLAEVSLFPHKNQLQSGESMATWTLQGTALAESYPKRTHIGYLTAQIATCGVCTCDF